MHATETEIKNINESFKKTRRIRSFETLVGNYGPAYLKKGSAREEIYSPASSERVIHCTILKCVAFCFILLCLFTCHSVCPEFSPILIYLVNLYLY